MDKQKLKTFLIKRETEKIKSFEKNLNAFIGDTHIDYGETRDKDDYSHHYQSATDSNAAHSHLHEHTGHLNTLQKLDFSDSDEVKPGAVIKVNDQYMLVAVAEDAFEFDGKKFLSISLASPVYQCMKGKKQGNTCTFNKHDFTIHEIF